MKTKLKQAKKFLDKGHHVKVTILFRRWEKKTMMFLAEEKLAKFTALSRSKAKPKIKGHLMTVTLM